MHRFYFLAFVSVVFVRVSKEENQAVGFYLNCKLKQRLAQQLSKHTQQFEWREQRR